MKMIRNKFYGLIKSLRIKDRSHQVLSRYEYNTDQISYKHILIRRMNKMKNHFVRYSSKSWSFHLVSHFNYKCMKGFEM